jgi:glycosyltransferase involved in cell wall biosynthesis
VSANGSHRVRVAEAGIRGVPANYGGSETAVEEIGWRLAESGARVVVYCRSHKSEFGGDEYRGMQRIVLPSIPTLNLDTPTHSLLATFDVVLRDRADVVHFHGMGNGLFLPLLALTRKKTVITIDGPDWERPKWGRAARLALRLGARLAVQFADHVIIDNHPSLEYFRTEFGIADDRLSYIPYGADFERPQATDRLERFGVRPRRYLLFVGALVPDKGPDVLLDAYRQVDGDMPLVVVGDSPFAPEFREHLRAAAATDPRVVLAGYVYGEEYRQLVAHAYAYVHPPRNEGTSPALLQAMAFGNCIVSSDIPETLEVIGDTGLTFPCGDSQALAQRLQTVLQEPELVEEKRDEAHKRARAKYSWDEVAAAHRRVYERVLAGGSAYRVEA